MHTPRLLLGLLAVGLLGFAPAPLPRTDNQAIQLKTLQGTWVMVSLLRGGKPNEVLLKVGDVKVKISEDTFTTIQKDTPAQPYKIVLDTSKKPVWMNLSQQNGGTTREVQGIIKLEKDRLIFCYHLSVQGPMKRPEKFDSTDNNHAQMILEREKR